MGTDAAGGGCARPELPDELRAQMQKAHESFKEWWAKEGREERSAFDFSIPAQALTVRGRREAEHMAGQLKALGVRGTYRERRQQQVLDMGDDAE